MSKKYGVSVYLDIVDGQLQLSFDCTHYSDAHACPWCMAEIMPPQEGCQCFLKRDNGDCRSYDAKVDALKKLVAFGKSKLKELEEERKSAWCD